LIALLLGVATQACAPTSPGLPGDERGAIVHRKLPHGEYMEYLPIRPDRDGWRKAAALPITVVVGTADTRSILGRTEL